MAARLAIEAVDAETGRANRFLVVGVVGRRAIDAEPRVEREKRLELRGASEGRRDAELAAERLDGDDWGWSCATRNRPNGSDCVIGRSDGELGSLE